LRASLQFSSNPQQQQHAWHLAALKSRQHSPSNPSSSGQNSKHLLSQTAPMRKLAQTNSSSSSSLLTADDVANNNSADTVNSTGTSTDAVQKPSVNPWYDQHLLGGALGWGSGLLYGMFNSSSKVPLNAEGTTDTEGEVLTAMLMISQQQSKTHCICRLPPD
jgi:hypothetical protein